MRRDRLSRFAVRHDDPSHALTQVRQGGGNGKDGHDLGRDGDLEPALHHEPVHVGAQADDDLPHGLRAEVDGPALRDVARVDVQALQAALLQARVPVVELMLQPGGERHHGEVVRVRDGVDVAGEPQGEVGERNALGKPAAGGGALDVERRAAGGLADGANHLLAHLARGLPRAPWWLWTCPSPSGVGVIAVTSTYFPSGLSFRPVEDAHVVQLGDVVAVGKKLPVLQPQLLAQAASRASCRLPRLRQSPNPSSFSGQASASVQPPAVGVARHHERV